MLRNHFENLKFRNFRILLSLRILQHVVSNPDAAEAVFQHFCSSTLCLQQGRGSTLDSLFLQKLLWRHNVTFLSKSSFNISAFSFPLRSLVLEILLPMCCKTQRLKVQSQCRRRRRWSVDKGPKNKMRKERKLEEFRSFRTSKRRKKRKQRSDEREEVKTRNYFVCDRKLK